MNTLQFFFRDRSALKLLQCPLSKLAVELDPALFTTILLFFAATATELKLFITPHALPSHSEPPLHIDR